MFYLQGLGSHQRHYKEEKTIIRHEWSFLAPNRKTYHLPEGHYKWYVKNRKWKRRDFY